MLCPWNYGVFISLKPHISLGEKVILIKGNKRLLQYSCARRMCLSDEILHCQRLALTSPTSGGRLVGIVRSRTKATELSFKSVISTIILNLNLRTSCCMSLYN
jgi:hypothetical protein